jgi:DNA-binding MarR family transcriptional regulator
MNLQSLPCYCATLRQAARSATALYEEIMADAGIHATQYTALQVLKLAPTPTTTEVAELLGIDQTTATRTLALIKKAGLAIDTPGRDRRERRWGLTPEGDATWRKLKPTWDKAQSAFEKRLGRAEAAALKKACFSAAERLATR